MIKIYSNIYAYCMVNEHHRINPIQLSMRFIIALMMWLWCSSLGYSTNKVVFAIS